MAVLAVVGTLASGVATSGSAGAAPTGTITSPGPLTTITTSPTLNCSVNYLGDTAGEFYGNTACGTFVVANGQLFGPPSIPAGSSLGSYSGFSPVSQAGPTGTGTAADPFRVVTTVALPNTSLTLTQTDVYVSGQQSVTTAVQLTNASSTPISALVYRAGDCYLENSDVGTGAVSGSSVACVSTSGRVEQFVPITGGSRYMEAGYSQIWAQIGSKVEFPNTCRCNESIDNGAGLSWSISVPANASTSIASALAFAGGDLNNDADGDGLLDDWETSGLDLNGDGVPEVDLPAMGATPNHKDLFVEVDWMDRPNSCFLWQCWGGRSFAPNQSALADVRAAFAAAPLSNPDGTTGVRVHIDSGPTSVMNPDTGTTWGTRSRSNSTAYSQSLGRFSGGSYDWTDFNNLQNMNFDSARRDVFHYALYADTYAGSGSSGIARGIPGDAFMVTDGKWGSGFTRRQEAGTFMHELGHTLNLHHGGANPGLDERYKPNYESIMNYAWQTAGTVGPRGIDYSRAALPTLNETALSESAGLATPNGRVSYYCRTVFGLFTSQRNVTAGPNIDWNCNGSIDGGPVNVDLNNEGGTTELGGANDWPNVKFDGGAVGAFGAGDLDDQLPPPTLTTADEPTAEELRLVGAYGGDGDGSIGFVGPVTLLKGIAGQTVSVNVDNVGSAPASFKLSLKGDGTGISTTPISVTVPGNASQRVEVPVVASEMSTGTFDITAALTNASGEELATRTAPITVVDPNSPEFTTGAQQVRDALRQGTLSGLDPQLAASSAALIDQVLAPAPTAPGAPTGVTALAGVQQASVSWIPPSIDGGSPITGYTVVSDPGGVAVNVPASTTNAVVSGLTAGTTYRFRVNATNAVGPGPASDPSEPVTPTAPTSSTVHVKVAVAGGATYEADVARSTLAIRVAPNGEVTSVVGRITTGSSGPTATLAVFRVGNWSIGCLTLSDPSRKQTAIGTLFTKQQLGTATPASLAVTFSAPAVVTEQGKRPRKTSVTVALTQ